MMSANKQAICQRVQANGELIERIISEVYRTLANTWTGESLIDGGAHLGYHAFKMAALPTVGAVFAVEANPRTFQELSQKAALQQDSTKLRLIEAALQADPAATTISFTASPTHPGRSGINPVLINATGTSFDDAKPVAATTIDKVAATAPSRIGFIKLDLEGGEYGALRGGLGVLQRSRPVVVFENGADAPAMNGYSVADFLEMWADLRYQPYTVFGEPMTADNIRDFWYGWAYPAEDSHARDVIDAATAQGF